MATDSDQSRLDFLQELGYTNMLELVALVELLERKGLLTKKEFSEVVNEMRRCTPHPSPSP
jgi:hypothetical protein